MSQQIKRGNHHFLIGGTTMAGVSLLASEILKIADTNIPFYQSVTIAGTCIIGGILLDKAFQETEYEKVFRLCGIENKDKQVPLVIKKQKKENKTILVLHLPPGISQKQFEQKQLELEQHFNAKIEFGFNKNLIMELIKMNLKTRYNYIFEECDSPLKVYCGESYDGKFYLDIEKAPHIIVAGETGSGKSSLLNSIILSLILNNHNIELHLIDFQAVELGIFENCQKVMSYGETPEDFDKLLDEMEEENAKRLELFRSVKNNLFINKLSKWNKAYPERKLPHKIIIVDEFTAISDNDNLMKKFKQRVSKDRKVGIHYIISMQRPDVECIKGNVKANMPTRIAFKTVSEVDSRVILDMEGAEKIKNPGRCLIKYCGELKEMQALYIEGDKDEHIPNAPTIRQYLKKYNKFKTKQEVQMSAEEIEKQKRKKQIEEFHKNFKNPYTK